MTNVSKKSKFLPIVAIILVLAVAIFVIFRPVSDEKIAQEAPKKVYQDVVYPIDTWGHTAKRAIKVGELKSLLGVVATDEKALDFYGKNATKYRYTAKHEPPLFVIESSDVLEIGWYFATAFDADHQKQASLSHAKKVYAVMGAYAGKTGESLVAHVLTGKSAPKVSGVLSAVCRDYECRIVLQK